MKCGLKSMSIKKVFLGGVKSALISVFESSLSVGTSNLEDVVMMVKMLWRWPCTLCRASRGLWTCTMACMLPLTRRRTQLREKKPRERTMPVKRGSLVPSANVEAGKALRHSELTSEHAGAFCDEVSWYDVQCRMLKMSNVGCQISDCMIWSHPVEPQSRRLSCSSAWTVGSHLRGLTNYVITWRWRSTLSLKNL